MNIWGTFYTFVLVFVIYFFLKLVYHTIDKWWREGMANNHYNLSSAQ